ncbi:cytochrome c [Ruegeria sp. 6PALISEP08]|uniref:c-type cytochrome n=1 Tax=Ruegeria sp. 6PALISEP08 TaxID=1225660 RepID=UPI00067EBF1A|nr:cytochrome c [Ruegeria sp. 6PALISEP08]
MREVMTKSMARNIFYGGSLFFILIFLALSAHSHLYIVNSENSKKLDDSVVRGKHVWEKHACINCHTILGEGAYFAPEVGNVMTRWGVLDDPESAFESLKGWMEAQPTGIPGRRQMPNFNLSDEEIRDLTNFLIWTDNIDAQGWPPNEAG